MKLKYFAFAGALATVALPTAAANAATFVFLVGGAQSFGAVGNASNTVRQNLVLANAHVTGVSFNVTITANDPSYLSEARVYLSNSAADNGVNFAPGFGVDDPGTQTFSGSFDLAALGFDFFLGADGVLRAEFFESFNDTAVAPDAIWNSGSITITYDAATGAVPEPATWAMMIVGFGAIGGAMRRRQKLTVRYAV